MQMDRYRWNQEQNRHHNQGEEMEEFIGFEEDKEAMKTEDEEYSYDAKKLKRGKGNPKRFKAKLENPEANYDAERKYSPWMSRETAKIRNPNVRLHNEIIELTNYLMPKENDFKRRQLSINHLVRIIKVEMPNVEIKPFGSYSTKLYLPNADIDLVSPRIYPLSPLFSIQFFNPFLQLKLGPDRHIG